MLVALTLVICCAGHALLLGFGVGGAAAAAVAVTGNWPVVAGVVGVALAGTAVLIRVQRHLARGSQHRTDREGCRS